MSVEALGACKIISSTPFYFKFAQAAIHAFFVSVLIAASTLCRVAEYFLREGGAWEGLNIRFLTIGMCFFAETICAIVSNLK